MRLCFELAKLQQFPEFHLTSPSQLGHVRCLFELIDPKIKSSGWGEIEDSRIITEFPITHREGGRLTGNGRRANPLFADYVLSYKNLNLAVVEAKKEDLNYTTGLEQAKSYAEKLKLPMKMLHSSRIS